MYAEKTVYIRVKLHNYTLYAGIHTYFFVRSVKNAKKMSAVLLKMTHLNGKILDFEKEGKIAGVSMQKMTTLSNN